ncbi:MAG: prepilin-type N-terminal cleavage/methylation domain-containing protein [Xanthomonadaceae bacterium]|nr:prepilin-type N-terminal cleavage/methylation domain-containing protein [Xanthomonadaceae bacterium]
MSARRAAGFTLIEILVAFAVLALGLTLLLGSLSRASLQLRQGGDAGRAALLAQSLLDEHLVLLQGPLQQAGTLENGRYQWRLAVTPWQDPQPHKRETPVDPLAARLLHVQLDMQWGDGGPQQQLHVASLRLATPSRLEPGQ